MRERHGPVDPVPTDGELLRRFQAGDEEAFDGMVLRYRRDVYKVAYRITGNHGEADDLAQETFCRAYTALGGFRGDCSLRTWLLRIVTNLSLNVVQSARVVRREAASVEALAEAGRGPTVAPPRAEEGLLAAERDGMLRSAIAGLPDRQRTTLVLRAFEGLPYKEIARAMKCSVGTAKANFFHAVSALRRELEGIL